MIELTLGVGLIIGFGLLMFIDKTKQRIAYFAIIINSAVLIYYYVTQEGVLLG